ncbi:MAG: hypothetical protein A2Z18_08400 [Armatimonadetes bacterium RBG_16_58_9]|nr:MAG: hypothetical protein A2Z18_08400 [Armatimonadetes bacterium RBG_16_58_9]
MRDNEKCVPSLRYRLTFYAGGFLFATLSYVVGILAYGAEAASWGDIQFYRYLVKDLFEAFQSHAVTFYAWQVVCIGIAAAIGHLLDREVYYRRKAELKASKDGLTELYNHRYFQDRLSAEIERAGRYDRVLSLIMLDIDDFKRFNDTWGHQEGDRVLKWFAAVCMQCVRKIDVCARYGGEEFVVILPEIGCEEALMVAERIREATEAESATVLGQNREVTVSAGVASFPEHGTNRQALILNADASLYYAKQQGKNICFVYDANCHRPYRASSDHVKDLLAEEVEPIEALGALVDARDNHAKGHSLSVMQLSVALGEKLGMSARELDNLRAASLLHDIGNVATPAELLRKSEPLEGRDWKRIEDHAGFGSQILRRVQQLGSIAPVVKHHHERYDGQGYPNGLAGQDIPLLSRIIAIADAFDAMTNARPYRGAKSFDAAVEELRKCAGTQFDPELVELFIRQVRDSRKQSEGQAA